MKKNVIENKKHTVKNIRFLWRDKKMKEETKLNRNVVCNNCKQSVKPKLEFSWLVVIATLLLFWPATIIYLAYRWQEGVYTCPICKLPLGD